MRRALFATLSLSLLAASSLAAPPVRYRLTVLEPTEAGQPTQATALNQSGDVVGFERVDGGNALRSILWRHDDTPVYFDPLASDFRTWATDISDSGVVVGQSKVPVFLARISAAWAARAEDAPNATDLQVSSFGAGATGITSGPAFEVTVGWSDTSEQFGQFVQRLAYFKSGLTPGQSAFEIPRLGGWSSWANDVNASTVVVGASLTAAGPSHAFSYRITTTMLTDLGTLGGPASEARAISDSGLIVGWADTPGGERHAFVRDGVVMHDLGTLGGRSSSAEGVNDQGQVVGDSWTAAGGARAFIVDESGMRDLNTLLVGPSELRLTYAADINNAGVIVGWGRREGQTLGYILEPTCAADYALPAGALDISDVIAYVNAFGADLPDADLAPPQGVLDFSDVLAFLIAFAGGCG